MGIWTSRAAQVKFRQALQLGHYLNSTCPRHRDFQVQPIYRHDVGSGSGPGPLGWEHDRMSRHFVVVAGITILSATTPVSASAQICDGALSWLCQALASSNRDASNEIQQDKTRRRLPTTPTTGPQRSQKPVSLAGRRLSRSIPIRAACPVPNTRNDAPT